MKNGLYNVGAYGLPAGAVDRFAAPVVSLEYGNHAFRESREDRYGIADLPGSIEIAPEDVVEVLVENFQPAKAVVRFPYDDRMDLVLVVIPRGEKLFVKTVWFNLASDNHRTLRLAPYSKP